MPILEFIFIVIIVFFAVVLHECAHGFVAFKLGDPTAKLAGRLTLNPLKHIDPFGTVILPFSLLLLRFLGHNVFIFGWAKPVPVNFFRLRRPKRDMILVSLAGPLANISLAFMFALLLKIFPGREGFEILASGVYVNLLLAVFNLMPVPPLDGSRLIMGILPDRLAISFARLERYGILIVLVLVYLGLFDAVVYPLISLLAGLLGVNIR
ncbi:MAG: site-2 protease family protein [Candidatus Omnitrophica bacterium]|nr:site-2 protease family protein [Candidatus Omnitrophota bacterium]